MSDINTTMNLGAHYSSNPKVKPPTITTANMPTKFVCQSDSYDAESRMKQVNQDINNSMAKEKKSTFKTFLKCFGTGMLAVWGIHFIRKIFKK